MTARENHFSFFDRQPNSFGAENILRNTPVSVWKLIILWAATIAIAFSLSRLFWLVFTPSDIDSNYGFSYESKVDQPVNEKILESLDVPGSRDASRNSISHAQLAKLQEFELFGAPLNEGVSVKPLVPSVEDKAVDTRLNLILSGLIGSNKQSGKRAIITAGNGQTLYAIGDSLVIAGGVSKRRVSQRVEHDGNDIRLVKILSDRVILDNRGNYESLWLYQDETINRPSSVVQVEGYKSSHGDVTATQSSRVNAASTQPQPQSPRANELGGRSITLDHLIKFSMARRAGEVIGYKIRPGRERELFERAGLQANDIVVSVNGSSLDSSAKAMKIYRDLRDTSAVSLDLMRAGKPLSLHIDLQQLEG